MALNEDSKLFGISVAAELADMHPQTLRQYDRLGLVVPGRTSGGSRRYSMRDVAQLREVQHLSHEGVSLEGIRRILDLENANVHLKRQVLSLEAQLRELAKQHPRARVFAAGSAGEVISLYGRRRAVRPTEIVVWRPNN